MKEEKCVKTIGLFNEKQDKTVINPDKNIRIICENSITPPKANLKKIEIKKK